MSGLNPIVVGFDGSAESEQGLRWAFEEAKTRGLRVDVVAVHSDPVIAVDPPFGSFPWGAGTDVPATNGDLIERTVEQMKTQYPEVTARLDRVHGHAADALVRRSAEAEMIVIGAKGHGTLVGRLVGSVSQDVLAKSTCMVVVVRGRGADHVSKHAPLESVGIAG
jgi:nucleotide-binding universal stress UspA family protein